MGSEDNYSKYFNSCTQITWNKMGHHFYIENKEILYLGRSGEYDTLSYFKFCANDLFRINNRIKNGETIKIISEVDDTGGNTYLIKTTEDFKTWVTKVFKGGFEKYFETGMD